MKNILDSINILLPIGITVGQMIAHMINGTVPPNMTPEDWASLNKASLDHANQVDADAIADIDTDQQANNKPTN